MKRFVKIVRIGGMDDNVNFEVSMEVNAFKGQMMGPGVLSRKRVCRGFAGMAKLGIHWWQ